MLYQAGSKIRAYGEPDPVEGLEAEPGDRLLFVIAEYLGEVRPKLDKLVKKAERYGVEFGYSVGPVWQRELSVEDWEGKKRLVPVDHVTLCIRGGHPTVGPFEFLAKVTPGDAGNIVDNVPNASTKPDMRFRTSGNVCQHCNAIRRRNELFVVRNRDTGEQLQIGRQCLRDYLGGDPVRALGWMQCLWDMEAETNEYFGPRSIRTFPVISVLKLAATCVRLYGWCSQGQAVATQHTLDPIRPTSNYVWSVLSPSIKPTEWETKISREIKAATNDADEALALEVIKWGETIRADVDSEYMSNLRVLLGMSDIPSKRVGFVISAIQAHAKAVERELRLTAERKSKLASVHAGEVGQRLRDIPARVDGSIQIGQNDFGVIVLNKFLGDDGNVYSWKTNKGTGFQRGEHVTLTGTVKEHREFKGVKETQLSRCVVSKREIQ